MKSIFKNILFVLFLSSVSHATIVINNPTSDTITVNVSNNSVNRIVFPSNVLDVSYSKEKGVDIKVSGNSAFIKYIPFEKETVIDVANNKTEVIGEPEIIYDKAIPSEAFFVTEGKTYAIDLNPQDMKAETIIINDFSQNKKKVIKYETEDTYIANLNKITKEILANGAPFGYKVKESGRMLGGLPQGLIGKEVAFYEGVLYNATLLEVTSNLDYETKLNPKEYVPYAVAPPKQLSIYYGNVKNVILPRGTAKIVIITKGMR